jgi:hypothetical protein
MDSGANIPCRCGRALDWKALGYTTQPYNASVTCEACGSSFALVNGQSSTASTRYFAQGSMRSMKGKGKEPMGSPKDGASSDRYSYGRLQLVRLKSRFVYNPFQGSEMEAPKYSGMLMILGREWWVPDERRTACSICATKFDLVKRRHHCRACG